MTDSWQHRKYGSLEAQQAMESYMRKLKETAIKAARKRVETVRKRKAA